MNRFRLTATLESPLAIKRDRQSERSEGARSISGTLLRGALATAYLQHHGAADALFQQLFLNENACRFSPLDPASRVFPETAATCKRDNAHGYVDLLWFRAGQQCISHPHKDEIAQPWQNCRTCQANLKSVTGFWQSVDGRVATAREERRIVAAHVGIDRTTSTAAESVFYTLQAVAPRGDQADLTGSFAAEESARHALAELLDAEQHIVDVGHHRTRGYGRVRLAIGEELNPVDPAASFQAWDHWSEHLIKFLSSPPFCVGELAAERDFFFSLSLPNGAILVDELLRYSLDPASMEGWLPLLPDLRGPQPIETRSALDFPSGGRLQCVTAVAKHERVRGWNAAHGLPKQDEWALSRGTVYLYWFRGTYEQRARLQEQLLKLIHSGIGVRRNEGYGVVEISDDFHSRFCRQEEHV